MLCRDSISYLTFYFNTPLKASQHTFRYLALSKQLSLPPFNQKVTILAPNPMTAFTEMKHPTDLTLFSCLQKINFQLATIEFEFLF